MATLALNSELWVRRLLMGWSPVQGQCAASEANDGSCPEKPDQLTRYRWAAPNLLRLAGFESIRTGMQVVMYDIRALLAMAMRQPEPNPC